MFSNSSHYCFRHSSFMFTASSESILMLRGSCNFLLCGITYIPLHIKPCFLHEHLAEWKSVLQLHFTKGYKCVYNLLFHYVKQVHCCIWNYVRREWHFVWSNLHRRTGEKFCYLLVRSKRVQAESSIQQFRHTIKQELLPPASMIFFFFFPPCEFDFLVNTFAWFRNRGDSFSFCIGKSFPTEKKATCSVVASHCMTKHDLMKFSQRSLLLLLPGLLLRPRLWLQTVYQSTKFCSAQVEREIIEAPVSPCLIQRERSWLFVLPV